MHTYLWKFINWTQEEIITVPPNRIIIHCTVIKGTWIWFFFLFPKDLAVQHSSFLWWCEMTLYGSTFRFHFGIASLPASLQLCFGVTVKLKLSTALPYPNSGSDHQDGCVVTSRRVAYTMWIRWTKGWFTLQAGQKEIVRDFCHAIQNGAHLGLMSCLFPKFSICSFQTEVDHRQLKL